MVYDNKDIIITGKYSDTHKKRKKNMPFGGFKNELVLSEVGLLLQFKISNIQFCRSPDLSVALTPPILNIDYVSMLTK